MLQKTEVAPLALNTAVTVEFNKAMDYVKLVTPSTPSGATTAPATVNELGDKAAYAWDDTKKKVTITPKDGYWTASSATVTFRIEGRAQDGATTFIDNEFKVKLIEKISRYEYEDLKVTNNDDLRFKNVKIDNDTIVDIDISFGVKTNKVRYSTDECLRDRLKTIKKLCPDQYKYVVANIIKAKELLKSPEVNAYKPRRSDKEQGGLGGVGIENWILQNGGSFVEACKTFIEAATDMHGDIVPFDEFKEKYFIWNFGENHFAVRDGKYPHNNFVADNMNENGYQKMANALKEYMKTIEISKSDNESKTMT